MPTKHARIALTRDPEVDAALKATARVLGDSKPDATLARELLLRGAQAVLDDPNAELDRWLDERDSLAHKLIRLLERELADVAVHDPHVSTPTQSFEDAILDADAVVIATNHREFRGRQVLAAIADSAKGYAVLADPWDCFDTKQVFGRPAEIVAAKGLSGS